MKSRVQSLSKAQSQSPFRSCLSLTLVDADAEAAFPRTSDKQVMFVISTGMVLNRVYRVIHGLQGKGLEYRPGPFLDIQYGWLLLPILMVCLVVCVCVTGFTTRKLQRCALLRGRAFKFLSYALPIGAMLDIQLSFFFLARDLPDSWYAEENYGGGARAELAAQLNFNRIIR
jgi:hypothetical protein